MRDLFGAPDYQGFSFAFFGRLLPLLAKNLLRIWDYDRIWGDLQVTSLENDTL